MGWKNQSMILAALAVITLALPLAAQVSQTILQAEDVPVASESNNTLIGPNSNDGAFNPAYNPEVNFSVLGAGRGDVKVVRGAYNPVHNSQDSFLIGGTTLNPFATNGGAGLGRHGKDSSSLASTWGGVPSKPAISDSSQSTSQSTFKNAGQNAGQGASAHSELSIAPGNLGAPDQALVHSGPGTARPGGPGPSRSEDTRGDTGTTSSSNALNSANQASIARMSLRQSLGLDPGSRVGARHIAGSGSAVAKIMASAAEHSTHPNSGSRSSEGTGSAHRYSEWGSSAREGAGASYASHGLLHTSSAKGLSSHAQSAKGSSMHRSAFGAGSRQTSFGSSASVLRAGKK